MNTLPNHAERLQLIRRVISASEVQTEDTTHNRRIAWGENGVIHTFVGGSDLHGAKGAEGEGDIDIYGVFIEKPEYALGVMGSHGDPNWATFQWGTAGNDRKNGKDDIDVHLHSLSKWTRLACMGNPTVLDFMFTPHTGVPSVWDDIITNRDMFLAKDHIGAFRGYAKQQHDRLNGRAARNCQRPELVAKYGYDTKMAMHVIRLMVECKEFMSTGWISLPSPRKDLLTEIRLGKYTLEQVNRMYEEMNAESEEWLQQSDLPETVDRVRVSKVVSEAYHKHWMVFDWYPHQRVRCEFN